MMLIEKTGVEIYSDIQLSLKGVSSLLCEILSGSVDGPTCSFINSTWREFNSVDIDENDDYDPERANKHPDDDHAFIFFQYILGIDPASGISEEDFQKAVYKLKNILIDKGYPSVVCDDTLPEDTE